MKTHRSILIGATLIALSSAAAFAAPPASVVAAKRALQRAIGESRTEPLLAARAKFEALSAAEPKSARLHLWVAYADWRLVPRLEDPKPAERFCKDGLAHTAEALRLDPKSGEALALEAGLLGLSTRFDPGQAMTLGPRMSQNMARAIQLEPDNPRIRLLDGINTFHTPEFVGGGPGPARAKLEASLERFAGATVSDSTAPDWGHEDALVWAGRSAMKLGDPERAVGYYREALKLNPASGWVRGTLLPEAEKAIAERGAEKAEP